MQQIKKIGYNNSNTVIHGIELLKSCFTVDCAVADNINNFFADPRL